MLSYRISTNIYQIFISKTCFFMQLQVTSFSQDTQHTYIQASSKIDCFDSPLWLVGSPTWYS
jgi:hypothetical protein